MAMSNTGEPVYDLIASVYQQAVKEAQAGDEQAVEWLDVCAPDWRELVNKPTIRPGKKDERSNRVPYASERTLTPA